VNGLVKTAIEPPNGLPISRRKRTTRTAKKPPISRAKRSAAWACSAAGSSFRCAARMIAPPRYGTTWHNGRSVEPHAAPDHAWHNGLLARRAFVPHQHHGPRHAGDRHHGRSRIAPDRERKRVVDHVPQRPNGLPISRRKRTATTVKKRTISRAAGGRAASIRHGGP